MPALLNVHHQSGSENAVPFVPETIGEAALHKAKGESVENAQTTETEEWFVMRPTYGRAKKAMAFLHEQGIETYYPTRIYKQKKRVGENVVVSTEEKPLMRNFLFVRACRSVLIDLVKSVRMPFLTPYYNHFSANEFGRNPYLTVMQRDFDAFKLIVETENENILLADASLQKFKSGQPVCVTDGPFKGVVGRVLRYKGQQRVFVHLQGVCLVATAYVPTAYLKPIEE